MLEVVATTGCNRMTGLDDKEPREVVVRLEGFWDYIQRHNLRVVGGRPPQNVGDEVEPIYTLPTLFVVPKEVRIEGC